ncbi:TPA: hypothetical protein L4T60_000895 [Pseudomonas aeruginosa]|nr:hypothetical protein [Pseudomonas aeruginosa]HBO3018366.1 hypothetical protein [Pseudomonas aeruginosa]HBO3913729.1 hypothetical protein [Pseudomonas aeruginosa]
MKFHSEEYIQRNAEFGRILDLASKGAKQVLIVSPDKIDSLDDSLKYALDEKTAKELKKNRKATTTNSSGELIELYLETGKTKSDFKKGNILLPWTSGFDTHQRLKDPRGIDTYYIPHSGPGTTKAAGLKVKDELSAYIESNPDSSAL